MVHHLFSQRKVLVNTATEFSFPFGAQVAAQSDAYLHLTACCNNNMQHDSYPMMILMFISAHTSSHIFAPGARTRAQLPGLYTDFPNSTPVTH